MDRNGFSVFFFIPFSVEIARKSEECFSWIAVEFFGRFYVIIKRLDIWHATCINWSLILWSWISFWNFIVFVIEIRILVFRSQVFIAGVIIFKSHQPVVKLDLSFTSKINIRRSLVSLRNGAPIIWDVFKLSFIDLIWLG